MFPFNWFPGTNMHDLDLDWLIRTMKDTVNKLQEFINSTTETIVDTVNTWLDDHPEATTTVLDGSITFQKLHETVADSIKISAKNYTNVASMKAADLEVGMFAHTAGYYNSNDTGEAYYEIVEDAPEGYLFEELNNGLYAKLIHGTHINPAQVGAVLDGSTDDTAKIREALNHASIVFPTGSSVKLNNLYVPDFKEIDFNGSFVYTDHYAIVCGATTDHGYVRGITIRNAHFKVPEVGGAGLHTYGGIYLEGAIKARVINCELANPFSGSDLAYVRNSFNCTFENCYCGTGNSTTYSNTTGISLHAGEAIIQGSDNLTNIDIRNCLLQNIDYGIYIDSQNGLTDSCLFENIGCSYVGTGIYFAGSINQNRNNRVEDLRVEFSDYAIQNTGRLSVCNIYMTRIAQAGIVNSGYLTVSGEIAFYNPTDSKPVYSNTGKINASGSMPNLINNGTLQNTGYYTAPYLPGENDNNPFTVNKFIKVVNGTSGEAGGSVTVPYPDGFDRTNAIIIAKQLYRSNYTWVSDDSTITAVLAANGIIVNTSTTDSTTFGRGFEICITAKTW